MGCASLVWEVIAKLQDDPTITFVSDTSVSISEVILLKAFSKILEKKNLNFFKIPFIAVTLCPMTNTYNEEFDYDVLRSAIRNEDISIADLSEKEFVELLKARLV